MKTITFEEWEAEGNQLFGEKQMEWKFVCPVCAHVQSIQDYKDVGAPHGVVAFSCIGRWTNAGPFKKGGDNSKGCNYAGGGLFRLNPIFVKKEEGEGVQVFDFARDNAEVTTFPLPQTR